MSPVEKIKIELSHDGTISVETIGIYGEKCLDLVNILEDVLEANAFDSNFTDDYYRVSEEVVNPSGVIDESKS